MCDGLYSKRNSSLSHRYVPICQKEKEKKRLIALWCLLHLQNTCFFWGVAERTTVMRRFLTPHLIVPARARNWTVGRNKTRAIFRESKHARSRMHTQTACFWKGLIIVFSSRGLAIEEKTFVPACGKSELRVTIFFSPLFIPRNKRTFHYRNQENEKERPREYLLSRPSCEDG